MDQHTTEIAEGITRVANLRMQVIEKLMDHITLAPFRSRRLAPARCDAEPLHRPGR